MHETTSRRRWLSFGIRDLLWVTLLAAMVLGWWRDHQRTERYQTALVKLRTMGFDVGAVLNSPSLSKEIEAIYLR